MRTIISDVAVVGGGPGGLAAAHAITAAAPHLKVSVFERSTANLSTSRRGAGLGLDVNGQKALQAINPELLTRVIGMASSLHSNKVLRPDGSLVSEVPMGQGARKEYAEQGYRTPCLLGWSELQGLLADTLPESVSVHTGMEFERYEAASDSDSVTAYFVPSDRNQSNTRAARQPAPQATAVGDEAAAGQREAGGQLQQQDGLPAGPAAVKAQLLVASDGYFSRVRRQCLADGPPEWGGTLVYRARLPAAAAADAGVVLGDSSIFVQDVGRFLFAYPISSGDVVWTVGIEDEKLQELGLSSAVIRQQLYAQSSSSSNSTGKADATKPSSSSSSSDYTALQTQGYSSQETAAGMSAKARCLQAMTGFWEPVLKLVETTSPKSLVEHGVYTRPASNINPSCFGKGRVVIIGDAAHPLRPTGQGLNQTLEDAWGLGKALSLKPEVSISSQASQGSGEGSALQGDSSSSGLLEALQDFREQRAVRVAPVVAFTTASGKAAYKAKKNASSEEAAAQMSMGGDTEQMTAAEFSEFCCGVNFAPLRAGA